MLSCGVRFADDCNYFRRKYLNSSFSLSTDSGGGAFRLKSVQKTGAAGTAPVNAMNYWLHI